MTNKQRPGNYYLTGWLILVGPVLIILSLILIGESSWVEEQSTQGCFTEAMNLIGIGRDQMSKGDFAGAQLQFAEAIRLMPDLAEAYFSMGSVYRRMGQPQQALKYLNQAVSLNPDKKEVIFNDIGMLYFELERLDEAAQMLHRAAELGIREAMIWGNIGLVDLKREDYNAAAKAFEKAIEARPNMKNLYLNALRERLYEAEGDHQDTLRALVQAGMTQELTQLYFEGIINVFLRRDAGLIDNYLNLAQSYEKLDRTENAIREYEHVLELDPTRDAVYNRLGLLYAKNGEFDVAVAVFQKALKRNPQNQGARKALNRLIHPDDNLNEN